VTRFSAELILTFSLALGVVLGGSLFGSLGGLVGGYPARTMARLAGELKLWAVVASLGGSFETFRQLEQGLIGGEFLAFAKQLLLLAVAFAGAHVGALLVLLATGEGR